MPNIHKPFHQKYRPNKLDSKKLVDPRNTLKNLELDDLVIYGLIPEFIGRIPVCAVLDRLTKETLKSILTQPRDALVKQFKTLLSMDTVSYTHLTLPTT